jgi:hypothetical protein
MAIEWTDPPVTKAEIPRGKPWSYRLPVRDTHAEVTWHCRTLPISAIESDPSCPARITINVPANLDILFGELTWQVFAPGNASATGRIVFRVHEVLPPDRASDSTAPKEKPSASLRPAFRPLPRPAFKPLPLPSDAPPSSPATPIPGSPASPAASAAGACFIEVIRGGATVAGLRVEIPAGQTVTIGRGTTLQDHDLDLTGRFETEDLEVCCSRRQAEAFRTDDGVVIKSVGSRPLKCVDATGTPTEDLPGEYRWAVGEVIALPGRLRLVLREGPR